MAPRSHRHRRDRALRRPVPAPIRAAAPGGPRRPALVAVALIAGLVLALGSPARPADAHPDGSGPATPVNVGWGGHWWASNGCGSVGSTWVPDRVVGTFDFTHACIHHDGCYRHRFMSRTGCDDRFHHDMRVSCDVGWPWTTWLTRPSCRWAADVYARAVRLFGASSYG